MNKNKLHIDTVLQKNLLNPNLNEAGDYSDFLTKLAEFEKKNIIIDELLIQKKQVTSDDYAGSWKRVIALFWFRRIQKIAFATVLVLASAYGLYYTVNYQTKTSSDNIVDANNSVNPSKELNNSNTKTNDISSNESIDNTKSLQNSNSSNKAESKRFSSNNLSNNSENQNNSSYKDNVIDTALNPENKSNILFENDNNLAIADLYNPFLKTPNIVLENPLNQTKIIDKSAEQKPIQKWLSFGSGIALGFHITSSFQSYKSTLNNYDPKKTNKHYESLSKNGKQTAFRMNYGFFIEKMIYKNWSLSSGINRFTLVQKQITDYTLNEAIVYDLDGSIAGYVTINPERIQMETESKIDFITVPLLFKYSLPLQSKSNIQFMFGSSLMLELKKNTNKFSYNSLEYGEFKQNNKKTSFKNIQYGISYNRNLKHNLFIGIGMERQVIPIVSQLSDQTETRQSSSINFTLSLYYKL